MQNSPAFQGKLKRHGQNKGENIHVLVMVCNSDCEIEPLDGEKHDTFKALN